MSLKYGLLGLLNYGKMTGYELDKAFKDSLEFFWQGQTSQVYRELTAMEKAGWLSSEIEVQIGKPNRKIYTITEQGRTEFKQWLTNDPDPSNDALHLRSSFLMKLFFSGELKPGETIAIIQKFRDKCHDTLSKMEDVSGSIEKYGNLIKQEKVMKSWRMVALFGKGYYESCEKWANEMLNMLSKKK